MGTGEMGVVTTAQAWGFFQVFLRVVALFAVAPVFGSRDVPAQVRIGLALVLALAIYPLAAGAVAPPPGDLYGLLSAAVGETLVGLLMGLVVSLLFQAVTIAGDLIDLQMGFGVAAVFNPALGAQAAMIGQFLYRYTLVVFLLLNGHHLLLGGVVDSFAILPAARFSLGADALGMIGDLSMTLFAVGLRIAAPAVATLLIVDVALALVSRAVPQMNVFVLGMPIKVVVGLVIVVAALGLTTTILQNYLIDAVPQALDLLRGLRGRG